MPEVSGNFPSAGVARLRLSIYTHRSEAANNRSLVRANLWIDKHQINGYAFSAYANLNSASLTLKRLNDSGTWVDFWTDWQSFTYDLQPWGKQVEKWLWAVDVWITHRSNTSQSFYALGAVQADVIGYRQLETSYALPTLGAKPGAPTAPKIAEVGSTSFKYTATQPSPTPGVTGREVQVATNAAFTTGVSSFSPSSLTNVNITGRTALTPYWIRSRVQNILGWSNWSAVIAYTTETVPGSPTLREISATKNSVTFTIEPPAYTGGGVTSYRVELWNDETNVLVGFKEGMSLTQTFTGLDQGSWYNLVVSATNAAGQGAFSVEYPVRTLEVRLSLWLLESIVGSSALYKRAGVWFNGGGTWYRARVWTYGEDGEWHPGRPIL